MLLASWLFVYIFERFRSFNAENFGSVGQRAAKLLAIKVRVFKKKSAASAIPANACAIPLARVRTRARSNHFQSLTAGNFEALWSKDLKSSAFIDLFPFSIILKVQEAGSILRVGFALLKLPHLHRAYLVTICNQSFIALIYWCLLGLMSKLNSHTLEKCFLLKLGLGMHWVVLFTYFAQILSVDASPTCRSIIYKNETSVDLQELHCWEQHIIRTVHLVAFLISKT